MACLRVLQFPDPRLKEPCQAIGGRAADWRALAHDLTDTMKHYAGCVGLAAPQAGFLVRMIVFDVGRYRKKVEGHGLQVLMDPVVIETQNPQICREGCLSVPDYTGNVARFQEVTVEGRNENGVRVVISARGLEAVVLQHELDHLEGVLFLDRVASLKTDIFRRKSYLHP